MASGRVDTPERLVETVRSFVVSNGLIGEDSLVLAAVSGGADSMAMLSILHALTGELGFRLPAGHFNHRLREPADAARERRIVEEAASSLDLPFHYGVGDVGQDAGTTGESLEEAARKARYRFLETTAERIGAGHIATGHTRSDQAETVLMRILRGAGIRGLAGIPVQRSRGLIIRPLLEIDRCQTRVYCAETGTRFADDPSNEDTRFLRNRIRLEVLPLLESMCDDGVTDNLIRLALNAGALLRQIRTRTDPMIDRSLRREADGTCVVDLAAAGIAASERRGDEPTGAHAPLDDTSIVVFLGDLFAAILGCDADLTRAHYEQLTRIVTDPLASGKKVSLPGFTVTKEYDTMRITLGRKRGGLDEPGGAPAAPVELALPGRTHAAGLVITTEILDRARVADSAMKSIEGEAYFDLQQISPPLTLRTPSPGDRMQMFGMSGTKKLSDIFVDKKFPASRRRDAPVIADSNHILWIVGVASSEITRIDSGTRNVVRISIEKE